MSETANASVNTVANEFQAQREAMRLPNDLMGGEEAMIAAGWRYIRKLPGEDLQALQERLKEASLFNTYKRTLYYLCGRVFEKPVVLAEGAEAQFEALAENVDRMGSNLTVWSRRAFEAGLNNGVTFCVVDFNSAPTRRLGNGVVQYRDNNGEWLDKTEAADRDNDWRPYFIHVNAANVLDARIDWLNGKPQISHFRYLENAQEQLGKWGTFTYQRIRAFYLAENGNAVPARGTPHPYASGAGKGCAVWEVWTNRAGPGTTGAWQLESEGQFSIGVIPVAVFMPGERKGPLTAEPALKDLAELNKRHWQLSCSHADLMHQNDHPGYLGVCLGNFDAETGKTEIVFGANSLCHSDNEHARLECVTINPACVDASRQELKDFENRMAVYGLQLLQPKTGNITATEVRRGSEENNSTLKAWALQFQDFLENCLYYAGLWWNMEDGPGVAVNTEFANAIDAELLLETYRENAISRETLLSLYKSLGVLPDDFDVETENARIEQETKGGAGPEGADKVERRLADALLP